LNKLDAYDELMIDCRYMNFADTYLKQYFKSISYLFKYSMYLSVYSKRNLSFLLTHSHNKRNTHHSVDRKMLQIKN